MLGRLAAITVCAALFVCSGATNRPVAAALAQPAVTPSPVGASPNPAGSPMPAASASPASTKRRLSIAIDSFASVIDQQFVGPGTTPVEGPGFIAGSVVSPGTPYDFWTSASQATGLGVHQTLFITPTYALTSNVDLIATAGFGSVAGSGNVNAYWGAQLIPTLNPHLGQRAIFVPPAFTTHNRQDNATNSRFSFLTGEARTHDGKFSLRGGWLNLNQSLAFIFTQPAQPNAPAQLAPVLPESLGDGAPHDAIFVPGAGVLPLFGFDFTAKQDLATLELTSADLPAQPGTSVRINSLSAVIDHGRGLTYNAQIIHVNQAGLIGTTVLFGADPTIVPTTQGALPFSTLTGQRITIGGVSSTFSLGQFDNEVRIAESCSTASGTTLPKANCTSGTYLYARVHHGFRSFGLSFEGVRFDGSYASMILPYGTLQNVWSVSYSWPGTWLKGDYQLVDNSRIGANREGIRATSTFLLGPVETRVSVADFHQIRQLDTASAFQPGFVEGYFLAQLTSGGSTLGHETHAAAYLAWHPKFANVTLDLTDITLGRRGGVGHPEEAVAMNYPAGVVTVSHQINPQLFGSIGAGRYAVDGSFDNSGAKNADLAQTVVFAGLEFQSNPRIGFHLQYRLYSTNGVPVSAGGLSPAYHGAQFIFENRFKV